jgi:hypothetical protein
MKRKSCVAFFLVFIGVLFLLLPIPVLGDMDLPEWRVGGCWKVRVVYANPVDPGKWSEAVLWNYCVVDKTDDLFVVNITRSDDGSLAAVVKLRTENLAPESVETMKRRRGKTVSTIRRFGNILPLTTRNSMAPIDIPVFPLQSGETYSYTETGTVAGDLIRERQISVAVTGSYLPEEAGVSEGSEKYLKTTASYESGEVLFTQYWQGESPWPVFGENSSMRYWRVDDEE